MKTSYIGTFVGLIFTIGSLISILTIFIPIVSVIPGAVFESISEAILGRDPYSNVGRATLCIYLCLFFISTLFFYLKYLKVEKLSSRSLKWLYIKFFTIEFFIIHGLGFYAYWALKLNYASDGQLIFAVYSSFPYSSISFVALGMLGDLLYRKQLNGT